MWSTLNKVAAALTILMCLVAVFGLVFLDWQASPKLTAVIAFLALWGAASATYDREGRKS